MPVIGVIKHDCYWCNCFKDKRLNLEKAASNFNFPYNLYPACKGLSQSGKFYVFQKVKFCDKFRNCNFHCFLGFYATFFLKECYVCKCKNQQGRPTYTTLTDKL